jgi:LPLT family lysophospholipid transporter-like MFS transporter
MTLVYSLTVAVPLLLIIGLLSGFFVVPMNALLQHRGHVLMSAGHSIAVQNFNENLSILTMLALYAIMITLNLDLNVIIVLFGCPRRDHVHDRPPPRRQPARARLAGADRRAQALIP